jgi:uncharacterized protein (DUF983 family)
MPRDRDREFGDPPKGYEKFARSFGDECPKCHSGEVVEESIEGKVRGRCTKCGHTWT